MKCSNCGTSNPAESAFCINCGAKLGGKEGSSRQETPAKQAEIIGKRFNILIKKLTLGEKLVGIGAILGLISFFLTWMTVHKDIANTFSISEKMTGKDFGSWVYLLPILMIVSLVLLYFSVGAVTKTKIKYSSYYTVIGTFFATTGIVLFSVMAKVKSWLLEVMKGYSGELEEELFSFGIGWWLLVLGSLVIIVGAFLIERENLRA